MKIGILSDTQDYIFNINKALEIFKKNNISFFIHAGDFVAPFSLNPYFEKNFDFIGVFGNNDGEKNGLEKKSKGKIKEPPYTINIFGKDILVVHDISTINHHKLSKTPSVIVYGHTHTAGIRKEKDILFINPGETCGWVTGKATVAILDLENLNVEFIEIK
ncbi:MAG: metallophosphoesterase [Candidatus Omnitrophica bacterium]|nr:metallophosphoesterase [Candidatus Omnitrophota bacterium]